MHINIIGSCNILSFERLKWFPEIPVGHVTLADITFNIQKSIILTRGYIEDGRSKLYPGLPQEIPLKIAANANYIAFLHTALFRPNSFRWDNNESIAGEYRINYDNGTTLRLPVTSCGNIRNFKSPGFLKLPYECPAMVSDNQILLYACCWKNPHPDELIRSIDIISIEDTATSIALFAVTALEKRPWDDKIFTSAHDIQSSAREIRIMRWRKKARRQIELILSEKNMNPAELAGLPVNKSILKVKDEDEFFGSIDINEKKIELACYLRNRKRHLREVLQIHDEEIKIDSDTALADELCNNRFSLSGWIYDYVNKEIDFYAVPDDLEPEPHWYYTHGLSYVGPSLAEAYAATGDEKYAKRLFEYFIDFLSKCPVDDADGIGDNEYSLPAADVDGDGWPDRPGQCQPWESSILEQIRHVFTQAPFYMEKRTNHATSIANKLIEWAACFPEFKCSVEWKKMGLKMIKAFYSPFWEGGMIYPDGSTYESHTGGYGMILVRDLNESMRLIEIISGDIPQEFTPIREKMYEWLLYITTPLRYASSISMVYHDFYGFDVEEISREAFKATGREDFLYIGTGSREGQKRSIVLIHLHHVCLAMAEYIL